MYKYKNTFRHTKHNKAKTVIPARLCQSLVIHWKTSKMSFDFCRFTRRYDMPSDAQETACSVRQTLVMPSQRLIIQTLQHLAKMKYFPITGLNIHQIMSKSKSVYKPNDGQIYFNIFLSLQICFFLYLDCNLSWDTIYK